MHHQPQLRPYRESRSHLTVVDDILLYDARLVIPRSLRIQFLDSIHTDHLGLTKCRSRARRSVWWPGLYTNWRFNQPTRYMCQRTTNAKRTTYALVFPIPALGKNCHRLARSRWYKIHHLGRLLLTLRFEIKELSDETSHVVIKVLKEIFAIHGIPDVTMSDNRPQYSSETFRQLQKHIISHMLQVQQGTLKRTVRSKERFARHAQEK